MTSSFTSTIFTLFLLVHNLKIGVHAQEEQEKYDYLTIIVICIGVAALVLIAILVYVCCCCKSSKPNLDRNETIGSATGTRMSTVARQAIVTQPELATRHQHAPSAPEEIPDEGLSRSQGSQDANRFTDQQNVMNITDDNSSSMTQYTAPPAYSTLPRDGQIRISMFDGNSNNASSINT